MNDRGILINRKCYLGSQIVTLKEQIPRLEKIAKRTPPKTLIIAVKQRDEAISQLLILNKKLVEFKQEYNELDKQLILIGAYG